MKASLAQMRSRSKEIILAEKIVRSRNRFYTSYENQNALLLIVQQHHSVRNLKDRSDVNIVTQIFLALSDTVISSYPYPFVESGTVSVSNTVRTRYCVPVSKIPGTRIIPLFHTHGTDPPIIPTRSFKAARFTTCVLVWYIIAHASSCRVEAD